MPFPSWIYFPLNAAPPAWAKSLVEVVVAWIDHCYGSLTRDSTVEPAVAEELASVRVMGGEL